MTTDPKAPLPYQTVLKIQTHSMNEWFFATSADEMQAFFMSRLPFIREAARELGWAIGLHGSTRRDFDLIAVPWVDGAADKDKLAEAIIMASCGMEQSKFVWEKKPNGRVATSFPICWPEGEWCKGMKSKGCVDLSVMDNRAHIAAQADEIAELEAREKRLREVLRTCEGRILNAQIGINTGDTKAGLSKYLDAVLSIVRNAIAQTGEKS